MNEAQWRRSLERAAEARWPGARLPALTDLIGTAAAALWQVSQAPGSPSEVFDALRLQPLGPAATVLPALRPRAEDRAPAADVCDLSLAEVGALLHRRALSSVELVRALLARIERLDSLVAAWATVDAERALASAQHADTILQQHAGARLTGIPLGIKDVIDVAGLVTGANFGPFADNLAQADATVVAHLRSAGGIVLGKTATVQFAHGFDPAPTRNPWRLSRAPGGSSSGSAAAVAARMVPAALGTQTGGSTLRPAAFCGVVGLKPTIGRLSCAGILSSSWSFDHPGVIARSVQDAGLVLAAIGGYAVVGSESLGRELSPAGSGPAGESPLGRELAAGGSGRASEYPPPRLGLVVDLLKRADPEVRANCEAVAKRLEAAGAEVHEILFPAPLDLMLATHKLVCWVEAAAVHLDLLRRFPEAYAPNLRATLEVSQLVPGAVYLRGRQLLQRFRSEAGALFETCQVLLAPTVRQVAPPFGSSGDASFQSVFSLLGLPTISLPSGLHTDGVPFAVQLVAPHHAEAELLRAADWCEQRIDPLPSPPALPPPALPPPA